MYFDDHVQLQSSRLTCLNVIGFCLSAGRPASKEFEDVQPSGAFDTFLKLFRGFARCQN